MKWRSVYGALSGLCEQAERQRTFNHTWAFSSPVLKDVHEEWSNTYFVYTAVAALVSIAIRFDTCPIIPGAIFLCHVDRLGKPFTHVPSFVLSTQMFLML
jgi:hypothetical protein